MSELSGPKKRQLMDKLRAQGADLYRAAMRFKEEERLRLKGLGANRQAAVDGAWAAVEAKFLGEGPEAAPAAEVVSGALVEFVERARAGTRSTCSPAPC